VTGLEADVRVKQADRGSLYASVVFQKSQQEGDELASSPRRQIKLGISRFLPWSGMDAAIEAHYIGSVRGRLTENGTRTADAPAYLLLNATLNVAQLGSGWRASLRVVNLLDRTIYTIASRELQPLERVPSDGRRFSLQLQREF
jgi:outer membrane receptor protein involved in Fe transport